jgi:hypothetical protein
VITPDWSSSLTVLAEKAPVVLAVVVCAYVILIGIAAVAGSLHPDEMILADAQKVLDRLLWHGHERQEDDQEMTRGRTANGCLSAPLV